MASSKYIGYRAGNDIFKVSHTTSIEELRYYQGGEIVSQSYEDKETKEDELGRQENVVSAEVFHDGQEYQGK